MNYIWKTNTSPDKTQFVEGEERKLLFEVIHHANTVKQRESIDRLIAEAPELLGALEMALEWIDALPKEIQLPEMPGFDRDEIDNLIAKAKGGQL